jgi:hypothetical protein
LRLAKEPITGPTERVEKLLTLTSRSSKRIGIGEMVEHVQVSYIRKPDLAERRYVLYLSWSLFDVARYP